MKLEQGKQYEVETTKQGQGSQGPWQLVNIKTDKKSGKITVWASEVIELNNGDTVEIENIESVAFQMKKFTDGSGKDKWTPDVNIRAKVVRVGSAEVSEFMSELAVSELKFADEDLPF